MAIIIGPEIKIIGSEDRFKIVKKVINTFIDFEKDKKGKGVIFKYPVEKLSSAQKLYIRRPGLKKNFDFKVEIPEGAGLEEGRHDQIALFLKYLKSNNKSIFNNIWNILTKLYYCKDNNVDKMLKNSNQPISIKVNIKTPIKLESKINLECLLKAVKWLFVMEDVFYWDYEGRATLYNYFNYIIYENNEKRLENKLYKIDKKGRKKPVNLSPDDLKQLLEKVGKEWKAP